MSNQGHDLSHIKYTQGKPHHEDLICIVVSKWNDEVTDALYQGAYYTLTEAGVPESRIRRFDVPGSFELPSGAQIILEAGSDVDAVICLGCVIQGETRHFDFISQAVADGVTNVSLKYNRPVIFGVLTPDTMQQALDRAGGKYGNKGEEAAVAALEMIDLRRSL